MRKFLALVLFGAATFANAASNFTFSNTPGPYGVGLHVIQQYDYSRSFKGSTDLFTGQPTTGERARPIQTLVWYPAQKSGKPMTYADYMETEATEITFNMQDPLVKRRIAETRAGEDEDSGISKKQVENEAARPMWAVRDASPVSGKFPVVIYAPSFGAVAYENADLCEFLASQGYLVISSPDMGAHKREMTLDLEGIEAQTGDIEFLISYAHTLPQADMAHVAVVGFSWGGISNVFAAAKDSRISAMVSLDGTVRYNPEFIKAASYVTPEKVAIPYLYVAARPYSLEQLNALKKDVSFNFLNQMVYSDLYKVTMYPMTHGNFSSQMLRFQGWAESAQYSREEVSLAHSWMVRYVCQFLNAYLKNDANGMAFMNNTPPKNGVPAHMLSVDIHHSEGAPPTQETLAADIAKRGFDHADDAYQDMHKRHPDFKLSEDDLNYWGWELMVWGKEKEAIDILKFGVTLYPENGDIFDNLASAYEKAGDKALAIKNFQRCLELDPSNIDATEHLKKLGSL